MDSEKSPANFTAFEDRFVGIAEVQKELQKVGLAHCGLIFGNVTHSCVSVTL